MRLNLEFVPADELEELEMKASGGGLLTPMPRTVGGLHAFASFRSPAAKLQGSSSGLSEPRTYRRAILRDVERQWQRHLLRRQAVQEHQLNSALTDFREKLEERRKRAGSGRSHSIDFGQAMRKLSGASGEELERIDEGGGVGSINPRGRSRQRAPGSPQVKSTRTIFRSPVVRGDPQSPETSERIALLEDRSSGSSVQERKGHRRSRTAAERVSFADRNAAGVIKGEFGRVEVRQPEGTGVHAAGAVSPPIFPSSDSDDGIELADMHGKPKDAAVTPPLQSSEGEEAAATVPRVTTEADLTRAESPRLGVNEWVREGPRPPGAKPSASVPGSGWHRLRGHRTSDSTGSNDSADVHGSLRSRYDSGAKKK